MNFNSIKIAASILCVMSSCKNQKQSLSSEENQPAPTAQSAIIRPSSGPTAQTATPTKFNVTLDSSGKVVGKLSIRLDVSVNPQPGHQNLPSCVAALGDDTAVAHIVCNEGSAAVEVLKAKQTLQKCYNVPGRAEVAPKQEITLVGCKKATISSIDFTPSQPLEFLAND